MIIVLKLLIVIAVVNLLRSSQKFREKSAEFDEAALGSLKKIMRVSEESGYPPLAIPLLILLSTIMFMAMMAGLEKAAQ